MRNSVTEFYSLRLQAAHACPDYISRVYTKLLLCAPKPLWLLFLLLLLLSPLPLQPLVLLRKLVLLLLLRLLLHANTREEQDSVGYL